MTVPETPVDENNRPVFRKHEVGLSGQVAAVEPEPESPAVQDRPDHQLRLCVPAPDPGHHPAPDFGGHPVGGHGSARNGRFRKQDLGLSYGRGDPALLSEELHDVGFHEPGHRTDHRQNHGIAELAVGLGVGNGNPELRLPGLLETHQACAFPRSQSPRAPSSLPDQHLRAVLVVACRQGTADIIRAEQGIAEPVTGPSVFLLVFLQVVPQMGGKRVLRVDFRIQNRSECGPGAGRNSQFSEIKGRFLPETHDEYTLPLLRYPRRRIDHTGAHAVSKIIPENMHDRRECSATVVPLQVFDILEQEGRRPVVAKDFRQIVEKGSLSITQEAVGSAERVLLGYTRDRERLARETG